MALDSKQKRGSAISMTMPFRGWLAEPDGTVDASDRASLLKLCSGVAPGAAAEVTVVPSTAIDMGWYSALGDVLSGGLIE